MSVTRANPHIVAMILAGGEKARLRRVIVDRYNTIEPDATIGHDPEADRARWFVTHSGIVVVPKGEYSPEISRYY